MTVSTKRAKAAWTDPPAWVLVLASACDATSQERAGRRMGVSGSMVNQVLGKIYKGDVSKFEHRVRAAFMPDTLDCPVLGDIRLAVCDDNRRRPFQSANPIRAELSKTCPKCPHNNPQGDQR